MLQASILSHFLQRREATGVCTTSFWCPVILSHTVMRSQRCKAVRQTVCRRGAASRWLRGTAVERWSLTRELSVLRSTCNRWVTTYVGKPSAVGQPTKPTQPFILLG